MYEPSDPHYKAGTAVDPDALCSTAVVSTISVPTDGVSWNVLADVDSQGDARYPDATQFIITQCKDTDLFQSRTYTGFKFSNG